MQTIQPLLWSTEDTASARQCTPQWVRTLVRRCDLIGRQERGGRRLLFLPTDVRAYAESLAPVSGAAVVIRWR